jgi:hypothetical protein
MDRVQWIKVSRDPTLARVYPQRFSGPGVCTRLVESAGVCADNGRMATSVSLSTRVSPELRERLVQAARDRGIPLGRFARDLLAAGVGAVGEVGGPEPLANEVECAFHNLPPEAGVRREVCLTLARTAVAGGIPGIQAGRVLIDEVDVARRIFLPEDEDEDLDEDEGG